MSIYLYPLTLYLQLHFILIFTYIKLKFIYGYIQLKKFTARKVQSTNPSTMPVVIEREGMGKHAGCMLKTMLLIT